MLTDTIILIGEKKWVHFVDPWKFLSIHTTLTTETTANDQKPLWLQIQTWTCNHWSWQIYTYSFELSDFWRKSKNIRCDWRVIGLFQWADFCDDINAANIFPTSKTGAAFLATSTFEVNVGSFPGKNAFAWISFCITSANICGNNSTTLHCTSIFLCIFFETWSKNMLF